MERLDGAGRAKLGDVKQRGLWQDPKRRVIATFVGAILIPSIALSYLAVVFVQRLATNRQVSELRRAERTLYYIARDVTQKAQSRALDAAKALGVDRLLDGRPDVIRSGLREAGWPEDAFVSLHLEGSSPRAVLHAAPERSGEELELSHELLTQTRAYHAGEDTVPWVRRDGRILGIIRYRYRPRYLRDQLLPDFFEKDFVNPDQALVLRVRDSSGRTVYETAPTANGRFEVSRALEGGSFEGLTLALRYRDVSIEGEVRRWRLLALSLVGFIDIMLGAGLYLVYTNVQREVHLSRLKSDFVANVSHELKTPLALIRLFAETLEMGRVPSDEKARQYYRVINHESQRLTQLIDNILNFSRIEAGGKVYQLTPVDVGEVVRHVLETYRLPIEREGFRLDLNVAPSLPLVSADKEALGQAVLNLLNNAIKYSPEEKYLRLDVSADDQSVRLSVTDRGIGVAKREQEKIFEKFYRAADSLVHATKGSGLGLSLVRHIMEAHGGSVEIESVPGKGSKFTLILPQQVEQPAAHGPEGTAKERHA